jgi:hypothetical protein
VGADVLALEIAQHGLGADGLEILGMIRIPDQPARPRSLLGQQPQKPKADLAVPACHEDVHARGARTRSDPAGKPPD